MMTRRYLEITFAGRRALVAYLRLAPGSEGGGRSTREFDHGRILVDYGASGEPLGLEILTPGPDAVSPINEVLRGLGLPPLTEDEAKPLVAA